MCMFLDCGRKIWDTWAEPTCFLHRNLLELNPEFTCYEATVRAPRPRCPWFIINIIQHWCEVQHTLTNVGGNSVKHTHTNAVTNCQKSFNRDKLCSAATCVWCVSITPSSIIALRRSVWSDFISLACSLVLPFASASLSHWAQRCCPHFPCFHQLLSVCCGVCVCCACVFLPVGVSVIVWWQCRLLITNPSQSATQNNLLLRTGDSVPGK